MQIENFCSINGEEYRLQPFTLVIFGGAGDLSQRKLLPAMYHLFATGHIAEDFRIIGYGMPEMSSEEYRNFVEEALKKFQVDGYNEETVKKFREKIFYVSGELEESKMYRKIYELYCETSKDKGKYQVIFYLAIPPYFASQVISNIGQLEFCSGGTVKKVIMEKPFGVDMDSAKKLNIEVGKVFQENEIYRIDHYLGKETVQNILFFRFGNSIFEPLWNRNYIEHVQITVAESIGIEHRGAFYEKAGVVRDIIQNHMMQLIALVAMEPPVQFEADYIRDEKVKVFKTVKEMNFEYISENIVRGQYGPGNIEGENVLGYQEEKGVSASSSTPTFIAGKIHIDNWRWSGIPFYIRSGKRMARKVTEIYIHFKTPPLKLFGDECGDIEPNGLILSIQPEEKISMTLNLKYPGTKNTPYPVEMQFDYKSVTGGVKLDAYERLIIDCLKGDLTLFARQDGIEAMWEIVDPINSYWEKHDSYPKFPNYFSGSWGPQKAFDLIEKEGRKWRFSNES